MFFSPAVSCQKKLAGVYSCITLTFSASFQFHLDPQFQQNKIHLSRSFDDLKYKYSISIEITCFWEKDCPQGFASWDSGSKVLTPTCNGSDKKSGAPKTLRVANSFDNGRVHKQWPLQAAKLSRGKFCAVFQHPWGLDHTWSSPHLLASRMAWYLAMQHSQTQ